VDRETAFFRRKNELYALQAEINEAFNRKDFDRVELLVRNLPQYTNVRMSLINRFLARFLGIPKLGESTPSLCDPSEQPPNTVPVNARDMRTKRAIAESLWATAKEVASSLRNDPLPDVRPEKMISVAYDGHFADESYGKLRRLYAVPIGGSRQVVDFDAPPFINIDGHKVASRKTSFASWLAVTPADERSSFFNLMTVVGEIDFDYVTRHYGRQVSDWELDTGRTFEKPEGFVAAGKYRWRGGQYFKTEGNVDEGEDSGATMILTLTSIPQSGSARASISMIDGNVRFGAAVVMNVSDFSSVGATLTIGKVLTPLPSVFSLVSGQLTATEGGGVNGGVLISSDSGTRMFTGMDVEGINHGSLWTGMPTTLNGTMASIEDTGEIFLDGDDKAESAVLDKDLLVPFSIESANARAMPLTMRRVSDELLKMGLPSNLLETLTHMTWITDVRGRLTLLSNTDGSVRNQIARLAVATTYSVTPQFVSVDGTIRTLNRLAPKRIAAIKLPPYFAVTGHGAPIVSFGLRSGSWTDTDPDEKGRFIRARMRSFSGGRLNEWQLEDVFMGFNPGAARYVGETNVDVWTRLLNGRLFDILPLIVGTVKVVEDADVEVGHGGVCRTVFGVIYAIRGKDGSIRAYVTDSSRTSTALSTATVRNFNGVERSETVKVKRPLQQIGLMNKDKPPIWIAQHQAHSE
jgi:hypothetical protein